MVQRRFTARPSARTRLPARRRHGRDAHRGAPSIGAVTGLLTVQEVPDELGRHRRAAQRGDALLDRLEELRLGLLAGVLPRHRLEELMRLAKTAREKVDEPRLALLLDEIDLRVAVELAKLDAGL